ncbi:alpha-glucoside transport system permease protein [Candidatus Planktophila dulcis]|jgi:alpha-glucoside transport system permease protein|uniref:carbohydrate ABC transporter permease n=1 Tax=Candidatus Planktophila dulcis TaxID=1884914 RepID=UPI000BAC7257|nr:sugar ABC transporter permease [Candidatus Planktophila dulcis]ASY13994.1 alpha-glucoside transport system permease protein [Candidatus Planktophila dulcis]ASY20685.1 alpha-glucoside transport system permease protein [Candidatus Planktophila dulcis]
MTWSSFLNSSGPKILQILAVLVIFFGFYGIAFAAGARLQGKKQNVLALSLFLVPALILAMTGLGIPAVQTFIESFKNADSSKWVGFANYTRAFKDPDILLAFRNTMLWIIISPVVVTALGLGLATMLNKMKREALAKSLIFMPMAISFVGGSLIWNLMYQYQEPDMNQTGLVGQIMKSLGIPLQHLLLWSPWNNLFLMAVYIWGTTGFGMVILSAAIKNIPQDIEEAAQLDGASGFTLFRTVTVPMVKTTIIVVLTTAMVGTLKLFDVIHTMTGGNFKTDVLSNRMFDEHFVYLNNGRGSTLAILIFLGVLPITYYNIRSLRAERKH